MTNRLAFAAGAAHCARYSVHATRMPAIRPNAVRAYRYGPPAPENWEATSAKHAMMTPIAAPARTTAIVPCFPSRPATWEGSPNTPLPMTEFTVSATRLQRPIARTRPLCAPVMAKRLYHSQVTSGTRESPRPQELPQNSGLAGTPFPNRRLLTLVAFPGRRKVAKSGYAHFNARPDAAAEQPFRVLNRRKSANEKSSPHRRGHGPVFCPVHRRGPGGCSQRQHRDSVVEPGTIPGHRRARSHQRADVCAGGGFHVASAAVRGPPVCWFSL